jgi:molybdopterin-guanine dinucleotide biosynthesis protein MobB
MKIFVLSGSEPKVRENLLESLVTEFTRRRIRVSVAVRMPEGFDMDKPGKDSFEHRQAGAREVVLASSERWALMGARPAQADDGLEGLAARLRDTDLLIADGFEERGYPRLRVLDPEDALLPEPDPDLVAFVLSGANDRGLGHPTFQLDDGAGIASFILRRCGLAAAD